MLQALSKKETERLEALEILNGTNASWYNGTPILRATIEDTAGIPLEIQYMSASDESKAHHDISTISATSTPAQAKGAGESRI